MMSFLTFQRFQGTTAAAAVSKAAAGSSCGARARYATTASKLLLASQQQYARRSLLSSSASFAAIPKTRSFVAATSTLRDHEEKLFNEETRRQRAAMVATLFCMGSAAAAAYQSSWSSPITCEEAAPPTAAASEHAATTTTKQKTKRGKKKSKRGGKKKQPEVEFTPSYVAGQNFDEVQKSHDIDLMPVYTLEDIAERNGEDGKPVWMTYGGVVYDVTQFLPNHPGGTEKIMLAAGGAIEPYWHLYRQHFASDLPMRLMEHMAIGRLSEEDQNSIDEQMALIVEETDDPYEREPFRHSALLVHSDQPMNAEVPAKLLTQSYLTPASLFYIRHHHPVPFLTPEQIKNYKLKVDVSALYEDQEAAAADGSSTTTSSTSDSNNNKHVLTLTLDDLRKMPKVEIIATLQCSGNRRSGFNEFQRTSGTPWGQGAISTAKFGGVYLRDVLKAAGLKDPIEAQEKYGLEHVRFYALDGMSASIGIEKACNPYGDVIVAYEMNDEPLSRDHGYPVRIVVPGYAAVRNVKWVERIKVAKTEADGPWQRGLNYKVLPPSVTDANRVNLDRMPSLTEVSLFSGITTLRLKHTTVRNEDPDDDEDDGDDDEDNAAAYKSHAVTRGEKINPGDTVTIRASGWAWAGGGRNIVRVDVTGDEGKSWTSASLLRGADQKFGRAWAWTFWKCDVPAIVHEDGTVRLASKAVDMALNVQPESAAHSWNVRGLGNNAWYRTIAKVANVSGSSNGPRMETDCNET